MPVTKQPSPTTGTLDLEGELPKLRALLLKLAPASEVDDLVQDVIARALRYRESFDNERPLGPWLAKTALHAYLDQRAKQQREGPVESPRDRAAEPDWSVEQREVVAHLLSKLEPIEREVLVRFHQHGESVREIAAAIGLPPGTIKSHLHRARKRLAQERP